MLIAIAGPDGAGKSTLSGVLAQMLRDRGHDAICLSRFDILDPELSPASAFIDCDILTVRQSVMAMPTATARLLFTLWSMAVTAASQLAVPGRVIIYDSYWMKHTAAEIIFGANEQAALAATTMLVPPDLTFYVRLPAEILLARKPYDRVPYECGMDDLCRPERFLAHQRSIQSYLDAWAERFDWLEVDGAQPTSVLAVTLASSIEAALARAEDRIPSGE